MWTVENKQEIRYVFPKCKIWPKIIIGDVFSPTSFVFNLEIMCPHRQKLEKKKLSKHTEEKFICHKFDVWLNWILEKTIFNWKLSMISKINPLRFYPICLVSRLIRSGFYLNNRIEWGGTFRNELSSKLCAFHDPLRIIIITTQMLRVSKFSEPGEHARK